MSYAAATDPKDRDGCCFSSLMTRPVWQTPARLSLPGVSDPLADLARLEGVPSGYASARDGIDVMLRDRGLRKTAPELTGESLLRGAHASAVLEGSRVDARRGPRR